METDRVSKEVRREFETIVGKLDGSTLDRLMEFRRGTRPDDFNYLLGWPGDLLYSILSRSTNPRLVGRIFATEFSRAVSDRRTTFAYEHGRIQAEIEEGSLVRLHLSKLSFCLPSLIPGLHFLQIPAGYDNLQAAPARRLHLQAPYILHLC